MLFNKLMKASSQLAYRIPDKLSVWAEFTDLAIKYNGLNLSFGKPSIQPPPYLLEELAEVAKDPNCHQYTSLWGHPELQQAISDYYSPRFNRKLIPRQNILITPGAMAAHFDAIAGLGVKSDDEILSFAPYFPQYYTQSMMANNVFKQTKMKLDPETNSWIIDYDDLVKNITSKTKVIMLNSPHNPTGKNFTRPELEKLSQIFKEKCPQAYIVNDCVYESVVFEGFEHTDFATIDDNWEKTVTIYSAGKLLSCTGWKIGWIIGPEHLVKACAVANEPINFNTNTISQIAIARALKKLDTTPCFGYSNYREYVSKTFQESYKHLYQTLANGKLPIKPLRAESGYFLVADISGCRDLIDKKYFTKHDWCDDLTGVQYEQFEHRDDVPLDYAFTRWLILEHKVVPMPCSLFYKDGEADENYVRLGICHGPQLMEDVRKHLG
jgi:aspartate/methionine/tyrosine aminotransferase